MKSQTFTTQLQRAIEASSKSRYRISQETGISEGQLSRFIHGTAGLSLSAIDRICASLNLTLVKSTNFKRRKGD